MKYFNKLLISLMVICATFFFIVPMNAFSQSLKASLAAMPLSAVEDKDGNLTGAYVDLLRALDKVTGSQTNIVVVPFKRSIKNLLDGKADFHIPLIEIPGLNQEDLPYTFSSETLFTVAFVLYTHKNRPLDINNLDKYSIATDIAHTEFFPFPTIGKTCISCAMKMVNLGRLDGFIFAQNEIDPFIIQFKLQNIHRQLYKNFDVKILIPKTETGKKIDKYFTDGIKLLKQNGEYDKMLAPIVSPYNDWQPR